MTDSTTYFGLLFDYTISIDESQQFSQYSQAYFKSFYDNFIKPSLVKYTQMNFSVKNPHFDHSKHFTHIVHWNCVPYNISAKMVYL